MNLDLGILWIEDSFNEEEASALHRRVQEAGFVARINTIPNSVGIDEIAREHQLFQLYDLILLDYRLQDENGDEVAPRVRALFPSTTILFYSGSAPESELRRKIADKKVEGVYCSERKHFIDRAGALIDQTARSLDRLSGMRGLAMRVVAECDELMKLAMISMVARAPSCADKSTDLDGDVLKYMAECKEAYETAASGDLIARLNTRAVDSAKLFKHFRRLTKVAAAEPETFGLEAQQVERLRELRRITAQYDQNVLLKRNDLGHVVEVRGDTGWVLQGSDEISVSDFADIRRAFAAHIDALREMMQLVTLLDTQKAD